jgi:hypothetical protein
LTYAPGKDTGRYWDAGAANVHWLIATDAQVDDGIRQALARVKAGGVFVEGNSFSQYVDPDFFIVVARADSMKIKNTAKRALDRVSAFYLSGETEPDARQRLNAFLGKSNLRERGGFGCGVPVFTQREFPDLVARLRAPVSLVAASFGGNQSG